MYRKSPENGDLITFNAVERADVSGRGIRMIGDSSKKVLLRD
jgi:hypothetical protein